ncbi:MAG: hypothetical protein WKF57_06080 [Nakamurella sp.]
MDNTARTMIIAAAHAVAGPIAADADPAVAVKEQRARVIEAITDLAILADDDESWANKAINSVVGENVKRFSGVVVSVDKEKATTRGIVSLKTKVHPEYAPDGIEQVRTERTDDPVGLAMAKRLRSLVGHKVLLRVEMEQFVNKAGSARKSRVVRHVQDLGIDEEAESA